jgi:RNA-binding protein 25
MKCGKMNSWKRVQGTAGKLQAFGFCEYADPESTLRALRLLRNFKLGSKSLSVKVDTKSRKDLQKYIIRKKKRKEGKSHDEAMKAAEKEVEEGSLGESLDDVLDDATKDADKQVKALLETIIKENSSAFEGDEDTDLKANVTEAMISMARQTGKIGPDESMEDIDVEVRDRVSDEIKKFRLNYKTNTMLCVI